MSQRAGYSYVRAEPATFNARRIARLFIVPVMPELPEVETTRRGIESSVVGRVIQKVIVREPRLRWRIPKQLPELSAGQRVVQLRRRAKYLVFDLERGSMILHLGMSGSLRVLPAATPPSMHDHVDIVMDSGQCLRFNDQIGRAHV